MAQPTRPVVELVDFSGGLNSAEPPDQIGATQLSDLRNLEYRRGRTLKRRRGGTENLTNASGVFAASSSIVTLFRHTPGQSETSMELWGGSNDATPELGRVAAGAAWAAVALSDAIASAAEMWNLRGVSFNGKLILPYNSAVDRLHLWDGTSVRRMGLPAPAAPTVANTGAGAYAATLRYYKAAWVAVDGVGNLLLSPLSASVSFTPSGAGTAARVTRPALAGEHETGWHLFGSLDDVNYYLLSEIASGTSTYDDSTAPASYNTLNTLASAAHTFADYYTAPISAKYALVDGALLLLAGSHETTGLSSTVFWTPALGTTGATTTGGVTRTIADDERVPSGNRIGLDVQSGGGITGIGGPIGGAPFVFKLDRTYALNPTNDVTNPYVHQLISDVVGCISHQGIVMAEDERGRPALYWPSRRGLYRYGANGLEYCGLDIEDLWETVNLSATYGVTAAYHRDAGQILIFIPTGVETAPNIALKFHVQRARSTEDGVRGGWTRDNGGLAATTAVCMFSSAPASPMGLRLKPYVAKAAVRTVYKADHDTSNRDDNNATAFQAYAITRVIERGIGEEFGIQTVYVGGIAESSDVTLNVSLIPEQSSLLLTAATTLTTERGVDVVDGLEISECDTLRVRVTDQSDTVNHHWWLERLGLRYRAEAPKGN